MNNSNIQLGNFAFKNKEYEKAIFFYKKAIEENYINKEIAEFNINLVNARLKSSDATYDSDFEIISSDYNSSVIPDVSIVIPVFNDEKFIGRALESCISQKHFNIEIICIDDKSNDASVDVISSFIKKDNRVNLIQLKQNMSALQARRVGVKFSRAPYIIFVDGDDQIDKNLVHLCVDKIGKTKADIICYGVDIPGRNGSNFEKSLFPKFDELNQIDILAKTFPLGEPAQGHLWKYCFRKELLEVAYNSFSPNLKMNRANDLPVTFLSLSLAKSYVSIKEKLYIYHMADGGSGLSNIDYDKFTYYCGGLDSLKLIEDSIHRFISSGKYDAQKAEKILKIYKSVRISLIGNIIRYLSEAVKENYKEKSKKYLLERVSLEEIFFALACYRNKDYYLFSEFTKRENFINNGRNILLVTNNLDTGGLQGVLMSQINYFLDSGFNVSILVYSGNSNIKYNLPDVVDVYFLNSAGKTNYEKYDFFVDLIDRRDISHLIDHGIFYRDSWLYYVLLAKFKGLKTIGWLHTFALRGFHSDYKHLNFLNENMGILDSVVALSEVDVTYWKLLGYKSINFLPNPPSPMLLQHREKVAARISPLKKGRAVNLLWYGRLQESAKRVSRLVEIAKEISSRGERFSLDIIGPESHDVKINDLKKLIKSNKLDGCVFIHGEKRGDELISFIEKADVFVFVSDIEGYPLVISEVQSFGLPVVMYELPWLAVLKNNAGVAQIPQGDINSMVNKIIEISNDAELYEKMSRASLEASRKYLSYDFKKIYNQLLSSSLPKEFRPDIDEKNTTLLMKLISSYFTEKSKNQ